MRNFLRWAVERQPKDKSAAKLNQFTNLKQTKMKKTIAILMFTIFLCTGCSKEEFEISRKRIIGKWESSQFVNTLQFEENGVFYYGNKQNNNVDVGTWYIDESNVLYITLTQMNTYGVKFPDKNTLRLTYLDQNNVYQEVDYSRM